MGIELYFNCFAESYKEKVLYYKSTDLLRVQWEKNVSSTIYVILKKEISSVVASLQNANMSNAISRAMAAINKTKKELDDTLPAIYYKVGSDFRDQIWDSLDKTKSYIRAYSEKDIEDIWMREIKKYLGKVAGKKIKNISDNSKQIIQRQLEEGFSKGEGMPALAARIKKYVDPIYKGRSMNIARTETCAAASLGGQTAAKETGLTLEKEWFAYLDTKTRGIHEEANGQTVPMDEPYVIDGEELMFPGDISRGASGKNICNCRCTELYHPIKGE